MLSGCPLQREGAWHRAQIIAAMVTRTVWTPTSCRTRCHALRPSASSAANHICAIGVHLRLSYLRYLRPSAANHICAICVICGDLICVICVHLRLFYRRHLRPSRRVRLPADEALGEIADRRRPVRSRRNGQCVRLNSTRARSQSASTTCSRATDARCMTAPSGEAMNDWPQNSMPSGFTGFPFGVADDLAADAIGRAHEAAVRHRVTSLNELPRIMLRPAELPLLRRMPADGRRVEQNLGALHRREPGALRETTDPSR